MAEEVIEQENPVADPVPDHFPMGLPEYAATVRLDPMLEAALAVWVPQHDRLKTEWDAILAEYRCLPIG